jgi:integrase
MGCMAQPFKHPKTGIYYYRRGIPAPLRAFFGGKWEWKVSLETQSFADARLRFVAEASRCEEAFKAAREQLAGRPQVLPSDAPKLADRWASSVLAGWETDPESLKLYLAEVAGDFQPLHSFAVFDASSAEGRARSVMAFVRGELKRHALPLPEEADPAYSALVDEFFRSWCRLCSFAQARQYGEWRSMPDLPGLDKPLSKDSRSLPSAGKKLSEVLAAWAEDKLQTDKTATKTVDEFRAVVRRFVELFGDLPVSRINRQLCQEFRTALGNLPTKGEGLRGLTAPQAIARAEAEGLPRASLVTVRKQLRALSAVLNFAVQRLEAMPEEPVSASGMLRALAKAASRSESRSREDKVYRRDELRAIFSSPLFKGAWAPSRADFGRALYWLPLLMAYTGGRREELAQLLATDVQRCSDANVWFLSISPGESKTVKTASSRRRVPLHDDLLALGFLEYAQGVPQDGRLFPKLEAHKSNGWGHAVGRAWAKYLRDVVQLKSEADPSHGFRHTFKTLCREVGIEGAVSDWITGHSLAGVGASYGVNPLSRMVEELKKFPSIATDAGLLPEGSRAL